jgi:hypothetical protein
MLAHAIKCASDTAEFVRSLPAHRVSLTAAVSDIVAISPTAINDKVERLDAESTRQRAATHVMTAIGSYLPPRTDEPDVRNWQMIVAPRQGYDEPGTLSQSRSEKFLSLQNQKAIGTLPKRWIVGANVCLD